MGQCIEKIVKSVVVSHAKRDIIEKMVCVLPVLEKIGWGISAQEVGNGLTVIREEEATTKIMIQCFAPKVGLHVFMFRNS